MRDNDNKYKKIKDIGILTLNCNKTENSFDKRAILNLTETIDKISTDDSIRALIITGSEDRFSNGIFLKEIEDLKYEDAFEYSDNGKLLLNKIQNLKFPTIAAINGDAISTGFEIALSCDIRVADINAKLGFTEASIGLIPPFGGIQRISKLTGIHNALYILCIAEGISASLAFDFGVIQHLSRPSESLDDSLKLANTISQKSKNSISKIKSLVYKINNIVDNNISFDETKEFAHLFNEDNHERIEGIRASICNRPPNW